MDFLQSDPQAVSAVSHSSQAPSHGISIAVSSSGSQAFCLRPLGEQMHASLLKEARMKAWKFLTLAV